jgi:virginiamycin B lyase
VATDGSLWLSNTSTGLVHYTAAGVQLAVDASPATQQAYGLTPAADGSVWFVLGDQQIGHVTPDGHITLHGALTPGAGVESLCLGPDGSLWFTEPGIDSIGRLTPQDQVTDFPMPAGTTFNRGITVGPDGNLYVALAHSIARVSPAGIMTANLSDGQTDLDPAFVVTGPDGAIWFSEQSNDRVSRLTLDGHITHFSEGLESGDHPTDLDRGADGSMWFVEYNTNAAVRIVIDPPVAVTTNATSLGGGSYRLGGLAAARGIPATYAFEYGTTTAYGSTTAAQPAPDGDDGVPVGADIGGLAPGATYHYRIVASGPAGRTVGSDQTFTTPGGPPPLLPGPPDHDGDGYPQPIDCNDSVAAIHPGAIDKPGDRIDQDCSGGDAPYPRFAPNIDATWTIHKGYLRFTHFAIHDLPPRARLRLTCHGGGCRIRSYVARISRATRRTSLLLRLKGSRLRRHAFLELRLSLPGYVTTITRWTVANPPRRTVRCLPPGAKKAVRCT